MEKELIRQTHLAKILLKDKNSIYKQTTVKNKSIIILLILFDNNVNPLEEDSKLNFDQNLYKITTETSTSFLTDIINKISIKSNSSKISSYAKYTSNGMAELYLSFPSNDNEQVSITHITSNNPTKTQYSRVVLNIKTTDNNNIIVKTYDYDIIDYTCNEYTITNSINYKGGNYCLINDNVAKIIQGYLSKAILVAKQIKNEVIVKPQEVELTKKPLTK